MADDDIDLGLPAGAKACGNCRLFRPVERVETGWRGDCRVMPQRGLFAPEAPTCGSFLSRARALPQSLPEAPGPRRRHAAPVPPLRREPLTAVPDRELGEDFDMTREELKQIVREALGEIPVSLAPKWEGGSVLLRPRDPTLQPKEISIDALLHKVVMIRDRLRVLEQRINGHAKLSDAEKVEMQQYVTRCYGSLTTFNVLFADEGDRFVGDKAD